MSSDWRALQSIIRIFQNTNGALKVIKLLGMPAFGKPAGDWYTWVCARERRVIIYAWLTSVYLLQIYFSIVRSAGFRQRSRQPFGAKRRYQRERLNKTLAFFLSIDTWTRVWVILRLYTCVLQRSSGSVTFMRFSM